RVRVGRGGFRLLDWHQLFCLDHARGGEAVELATREHRVERWELLERHLVGVGPDAPGVGLEPGDPVLQRAGHHHHDVVRAGGDRIWVARLDRAEQAQHRAVEARRDLHRRARHGRGKLFRHGRRCHHAERREACNQALHCAPAAVRTAIENGLAGASTNVTPKRTATPRTRSARRARNWSPRRYFPAAAPNWAPTVPPIIRQKASRISTLWLVRACRIVVTHIIATTCSSEVPTTTLAGTRSR